MSTTNENKRFSMSQQRPSDVGFCVVDSNADFIADALVRRLRETAAEMESQVNRLYRGRNSYDLNAVARLDLDKTLKRLSYVTETLREVQKAQADGVTYLQAAE
jgi:GTP1/Obg family GTP-binding protein